MYVAALMECMRGPVDDMLSPSYQRLRQLIEAHVRAPHTSHTEELGASSYADVHPAQTQQRLLLCQQAHWLLAACLLFQSHLRSDPAL